MEELARLPGDVPRGQGGRQLCRDPARRTTSPPSTCKAATTPLPHRPATVLERARAAGPREQLAAGDLGGWLVVAGQLTLGQLVASELIITAIVAAVAKLGKQIESFYDLMAATDKLGVLLDLPLEDGRGHRSGLVR